MICRVLYMSNSPITIAVTTTSRRPGFVPPEPDEQTYSSYANAARGLAQQRLTVPIEDDGGVRWGRTERGHTTTAVLVGGDRREFNAAMWAVADLSATARRLQDARDAEAAAMLEAEQFGRRAMKAGRPQAQVARDLGVDRMTVRKWLD
jgi:hypothetical protein